MSGVAPGDAALVEKYLEHVRVEKRLAQRTVELYALDLHKLQAFARDAGVDLLRVQVAHIRRWVAQMHGAGRSGRGIALILSGWRGFYAWLGKRGEVPSNPVTGVRAPRSPRPLPKALSVDDAVQLAAYDDDGADATALAAAETAGTPPPLPAAAPTSGAVTGSHACTRASASCVGAWRMQ